MVCDKCKQKTYNKWIPGNLDPKYEITEHLGLGDYSPIYLCRNCSKLFQKWLNTEEIKVNNQNKDA